MAFYLNVENEKIVNCSNQDLTSGTLVSYPVTEEVYYNYITHEDRYKFKNGAIVEDETFAQRLYEMNKEDFEGKFLSTSKGNYRLEPKGYANAQQSIDTINNMVNALGGLTQEIASMIIFYPTPDFSKEEQCTEEWLVANQYHAEPMTKEQWVNYYVEFTTLYAQKMYQQAIKSST